jgi:cytochrome P450
LYLLARAPEWQEAVRDEVSRVAGNMSIGAEHIDKFVTTSRVLKESMRLYPPVPVVARQPKEPFELAGVTAPAGAQIVVPIFAVHRHRKYWHDPDRFDPDRFLPEHEASRARTQFMPFGAGPRICLGQSFAMIEAVTLLATFVRGARFEWDGAHLPEPVSRITLRPRGGMRLKVTPIG